MLSTLILREKALKQLFSEPEIQGAWRQKGAHLVIMLNTRPGKIVAVLIWHLDRMVWKIGKRTIRIPSLVEGYDAWFIWIKWWINFWYLRQWWNCRRQIRNGLKKSTNKHVRSNLQCKCKKQVSFREQAKRSFRKHTFKLNCTANPTGYMYSIRN